MHFTDSVEETLRPRHGALFSILVSDRAKAPKLDRPTLRRVDEPDWSRFPWRY